MSNMEESNDIINKSSSKKRKRMKKGVGVNRKARLIVRNLSFKSTEASLKEHFSKYGTIEEVIILKRPDGKLVGCGFVQFQTVQIATKALFHENGKLFMGRPIVVDWAVAKSKFLNEMNKIESNSDENVQPGLENVDIKEENVENKEENGEVKDNIVEIKEESSSDEEMTDIKKDIDLNGSSESNAEPTRNPPSNDVVEGRTVFIKNVPFQATNADLKEVMRQFGRVFYALICKDRNTEHSKGTAFVKFIEVGDAEKCLQAGTELTLFGNVLDCHKALNKKEVVDKTQKKTEPKDARNLYLVKEGVILAGSSAAEGVSKTDMEQRLQQEQWKTQILRNLNMFVSRVRLVVHNLPATWDDTKLRALFLKYGGSKAVVTEAKVMRDLKNVDSKGIGTSKEFGFVSFTNHENALFALRAINNNPNIFTSQKRPIVNFSIENRVMINAKQRRLDRSKQKNPTSWKDNQVNNKQINAPPNGPVKRGQKRSHSNVDSDIKTDKFCGEIATTDKKKLRTRFNLRTQAQIHNENIKKQRSQKMKQAALNRNKEHIRQPKQKQNKKRQENDLFMKMVNKYKTNLSTASEKNTRWYE